VVIWFLPKTKFWLNGGGGS